jgi:hypothetical protein
VKRERSFFKVAFLLPCKTGVQRQAIYISRTTFIRQLFSGETNMITIEKELNSDIDGVEIGNRPFLVSFIVQNLFAGAAARCSGPGGFYNIGNIVALSAGLAVQITSGTNQQNILASVGQYLFGNPAAGCLTLSMLIFMVGGEAYHRAGQTEGADAVRFNRIGDFLAGIAATVLTVALIGFGETQLALLAGTMLALGKFGTFIVPEGVYGGIGKAGVPKTFRLLVIASRFPSLVALAITVVGFFEGSRHAADGLVAATMIGCYLLWLWADCLLLMRARK